MSLKLPLAFAQCGVCVRGCLCLAFLLAAISCAEQKTAVQPDPEHRVERGEQAISSDKITLAALSEDEFFEKVRRNESFSVIYTHPGCSITPQLLSLISKEREFDWSNVFLISRSEGAFSNRFMADYVPYVIAYPFVFHMRDKTAVDYVLGVNNIDILKGFVLRNRGERPALRTPKDAGIDNYARFLTSNNYTESFELSGFDFSDLALTRRSFSGSNLKGANFNRTKLKFVTFSQADLTGASFDGAELTFVFWGDTICPDGTPSRDHGFTCEGHGAPKQRQHQDPGSPFEGPFRNPDGTVTPQNTLIGMRYMFSKKYKTLYREPRLLSAQDAKARIDHIYEDTLDEGSRGRIVKMRARMEGKDYKVYDFVDEAGLRSFLLAIPNIAQLRSGKDGMIFTY